MFIGSVFLQLVVSAGLLNVWVLRRSKSTEYRGGDSQTLKQEFEAYGLSEKIYYLVGFLKITSAVAILASFWMPFLRIYAASTVVLLMVGALLMHVKVKDPINKSIPAFLMLIMSVALILISIFTKV
jgi:hypothetical protein